MDVTTECDICQKQFKCSYLRLHVRRFHPDITKHQSLERSKIKCSLCKEKFINRQQLRNHIHSKHEPITERKIWFHSMEEFIDWLQTEEEKLKLNFTRMRVPYVLKDQVKTVQYYCQYDYRKHDAVHPAKRKRALRTTGSYKLDGCCPAGINLLEHPQGNVEVTYYTTHVGHTTTLAHFRLPVKERKIIADELKAHRQEESEKNEYQDKLNKLKEKHQFLQSLLDTKTYTFEEIDAQDRLVDDCISMLLKTGNDETPCGDTSSTTSQQRTEVRPQHRLRSVKKKKLDVSQTSLRNPTENENIFIENDLSDNIEEVIIVSENSFDHLY